MTRGVVALVALSACRPEPDMVTAFDTEIFCESECPPLEQFNAAQLFYANAARPWRGMKHLVDGYKDLNVEVTDHMLLFGPTQQLTGGIYRTGPVIQIYYANIAKHWKGLWLTAFCHELGHMFNAYVARERLDNEHEGPTFALGGVADGCAQFLVDNFAQAEDGE